VFLENLMKKDYVLVASPSEGDDLDFVDKFWTERWQKNVNLPDPEFVALREEFKLMKPTLEKAGKGASILDAGCGMGEWTVFLNQLGYQTTGLDISEETIRRLQTIFPNHEFMRGDIRKTVFPAETFDLLFSWGAFEHFENGPGECLRESFRILKPGGCLFISVPFDNWRHVLRSMRSLEDSDPYYHPDKAYPGPMRFYQWRFTRSEIEQEVVMAGFKTMWIKPVSKEAGITRWLEWDVRIAPGSRLYKLFVKFARRFLPSAYAAHMLMIAAYKPE
jgi:SAM-dependent methyltransferase